MRARLRHPHLHPPPPRGKNPEPNDNRRSESIRIIRIRKAKGKLRVKDLSGFKTLRSVFEGVCPVLLESIASAEKFDTQNEGVSRNANAIGQRKDKISLKTRG
jgi:hypothetical protein